MARTIRIEELSGSDAMQRVQDLEREIWESEDVELLPVTLLVAMEAAGAVVLGAFDGSELVGFAQGFPAIEHGRTTFHSHTLAVRSEYRGHDLGLRLKLEQRERVLRLGVAEITWTFDPLQSMNAHFNFAKLGVLADDYRVDFYGRGSSSPLLGESTDRFWVRWFLASPRVESRIGREPVADAAAPSDAVRLLDIGISKEPVASGYWTLSDTGVALVRIPRDINAIRRDDPSLAAAWRTATRDALTNALGAGFVVASFERDARGGLYVLRRGRIEDFAAG